MAKVEANLQIDLAIPDHENSNELHKDHNTWNEQNTKNKLSSNTNY